jgi:membrane-associated phospholipid phosphatase
MDWIDLLSKMICYLSHLYFLILILFVILMKRKYQLFYAITIICTSSGILNGALKSVFQIPLMSHLGPGYAFPSGHLQMSAVFYGYLCLQRIISRFFYLILIASLAWAIYMQNYHTPIELLAGLITGIMVLVIFKHTTILNYQWLILLSNSLLLVLAYLQHMPLHTYIQFYVVSCIMLTLKRIIEFK